MEARWEEEKATAQEQVPFSVDLMKGAKQQLHLLAAVDRFPSLWSGPVVAHAIRRYERCWLAIVAEDEACVALQPPLDVQWVWHCHMLSPVAYAEDCQRICGRLVDPGGGEAMPLEECRRRWNERFPDEPYDLDLTATGAPVAPERDVDERDPQPLKCHFDLAAAVERQKDFFFQVDRPHFSNDTFLQAALVRYKQFLHAVAKAGGDSQFLVPTYDIDIMWHSHMRCPAAYASDTSALLRRVLAHDDTDASRAPGQRLDSGYRETCALWEELYGEAYERAGAMWRGERPAAVPPAPPAAQDQVAIGVPVGVAEVRRPQVVVSNPTHVPRRQVIEVCITVHAARNLPGIKSNCGVFVQVSMLQRCPRLKLRTAETPYSQSAAWGGQRFVLECEEQTEGVLVELFSTRRRMMGMQGPRLLGHRAFTWTALLAEGGGLGAAGLFPLSAWKGGSDAHPTSGPALHLTLSVAPPAPAPFLFAAVAATTTDDEGAMLSPRIESQPNQPAGGVWKLQRGRWATRAIYDHAAAEQFVARIRKSDGIWSEGGTRPQPVGPHEKVILLHEKGFSYIDGYKKEVGLAKGRILAYAQQLVTTEPQAVRQWSLLGGRAVLTVVRDMIVPNWTQALQLTLVDRQGAPVRLLAGRKLQYEVPEASAADEKGFMTLVRYPADAPHGRATALCNWKTTACEVAQDEEVALVLLLTLAVTQAVVDIERYGQSQKFPARIKWNFLDPPAKHWESVSVTSAPKQKALPQAATRWWTKPSDAFGLAGPGGVGRERGVAGGCGSGGCGAVISSGGWGASAYPPPSASDLRRQGLLPGRA